MQTWNHINGFITKLTKIETITLAITISSDNSDYFLWWFVKDCAHVLSRPTTITDQGRGSLVVRSQLWGRRVNKAPITSRTERRPLPPYP
ncbi:hypothetical protein AVEN_233229-1 [Araneus ventricosus]|uniref:Uncharacterized protein n=1 Tax=Araneus ventricosus TaxID=182803 RepID=A0A4Y2EJN4_ARAVE|nr:hypothetical protein AVEN_233229-1 [Araneus ventricosus]